MRLMTGAVRYAAVYDCLGIEGSDSAADVEIHESAKATTAPPWT